MARTQARRQAPSPARENGPPSNLAFGGGVPIIGHHGYWATDPDTGKRVWVKSTLTAQDKAILRARKGIR